MYVLKPPKGYSFEKVGIKGKIFPMRKLTDKTQFVIVETETGHETTIIERISNFNYYILEGKGYFEIDGEKENVEPGNLVVIPPEKKFTYKGKLKMLFTTTPPWQEDQEETF